MPVWKTDVLCRGNVRPSVFRVASLALGLATLMNMGKTDKLQMQQSVNCMHNSRDVLSTIHGMYHSMMYEYIKKDFIACRFVIQYMLLQYGMQHDIYGADTTLLWGIHA